MVMLRSDAIDNYLNYRLRDARLKKKFSLQTLGVATGVKVPTLSAYERLRCFPSEPNAQTIARILEEKVDVLFPESLHTIIRDVRQERIIRYKINNKPIDLDRELEDTKESDRAYDLDRTMESDLVNNALSLLPERKRRVMQLRYGIGGIKPHTFEEIGHIMGISKQAVSQIHYNLTTEFAFLVNLARVGRAYRQSIR